jgi:hydrogenase expression/formation protein HypD
MSDFDAAVRYPMKEKSFPQNNGCISGLILQGKKKPCECPLFGTKCIPETSLAPS